MVARSEQWKQDDSVTMGSTEYTGVDYSIWRLLKTKLTSCVGEDGTVEQGSKVLTDASDYPPSRLRGSSKWG